MIEKLTQPVISVIKYGRFLLSLETVEPGQQPASITYYTTKEAPLDGEPQSAGTVPISDYTPKTPNAGVSGPRQHLTSNRPDYTPQLNFHQQELTRDLPPSMLAYHRQKVAVLSGLVIKEAA